MKYRHTLYTLLMTTEYAEIDLSALDDLTSQKVTLFVNMTSQ